MKNRRIIYFLIWNLIINIALVLFTLYLYLLNNFSNVTFGQLIVHMNMGIEGTGGNGFSGAYVNLFELWIIKVLIYALVFVRCRQKKKNLNFKPFLSLCGIVLGLVSVILNWTELKVGDYIQSLFNKSVIYEECYVSPDAENVIWTDNRNLILIVMESMEQSYADRDSGGEVVENLIPNLCKLQSENVNFGKGFYDFPGATFTSGALTSITAGVPLSETCFFEAARHEHWEEESESYYLNGAKTLTDILAVAGYNQEFMCGSNGNFGGRESYFENHGGVNVFDYYTAIEEGKISEGYYVWWGFEDAKLYEYAREEIEALSNCEEPFNMMLLTVDTHFTDGYICDLCDETEHSEKYSNVISCADRQVKRFIDWCKGQPFYDNTTIVITGDHLTMDSAYPQNMGMNPDGRRVYFTVINPAPGLESTGEREFTSLDIFPTILASIGAEIEGNRLGLGTNLFSDVKTLPEEMGVEVFKEEIMKKSDYYEDVLLGM